MTCCQRLADLQRASIDCEQLVISGWYDGVISGAYRCAVCRATSSLWMIAEDFELERRIFAFAPLPAPVFKALLAMPCFGDLARATTEESALIHAAWREVDLRQGPPAWLASGRSVDGPLRWRAVTPELAQRLATTPVNGPLAAWEDVFR